MIKAPRTLDKNSPLAIKVTFSVILISSLITFLAILLLMGREYRLSHESLEQQFAQLQQIAVQRLSQHLWSFDLDAIQLQLDELIHNHGAASASVSWRDWNGDIKSIHRESTPAVPSAARATRSFPITYTRRDGQNEELGVLEISVDQQATLDRIWEQFLFIILFQGLKTLIMAGASLWIINWLIIRNLKKIARYAETLQLSTLYRPLKLERNEKHPDELSAISQAINAMRVQLANEMDERQQSLMALESEKIRSSRFQSDRDRLEEGIRYRKHFVTNISHEIRTPMNGIIGVIDLLSSTSLNDKQRHYLELMQLSSISLLSILNDILDYSKIEAGEFRLEPMTIDLQTLAEESIKSFAATAFNRNLTLTIETRLLNRRHLKADGKRIKQILLNLINNAIKFTNTGTISLKVTEVTRSLETGVRIEVQDTGVGIPPEEQKNIFRPFKQGLSTHDQNSSGLGLALCRKLVSLMGGKIGVHSQPGQGSCFWLEIDPPVATDAPPATTHAGQKALVLSGLMPELAALRGSLEFAGWQVVASRDTSHLKLAEQFQLILIDADLYSALSHDTQRRLKASNSLLLLANLNQAIEGAAFVMRPVTLSHIQQHLNRTQDNAGLAQMIEVARFDHLNILVAEDNDINQDVIRALLNSLRIQPIICSNGEEVVSAYRAAGGAVDLVLMDCEMPLMDGFEATRRIRELERECGLAATPIVALTAHVLPEHRDRMVASGMDHFLSKPVRKDAVQKLLQSLGLERRLRVLHGNQEQQN